MRMGSGVEWGVHVLLVLAWLDDDEPVPAAQLADSYELSRTYLNKHLQAMVQAGLLTSVPGVKGGFRLARPAERISLLDVVQAIEGPDEAFHCAEIRRRGLGRQAPPSHFQAVCSVQAAMQRAERAWREELAARSIQDLRNAADRRAAGMAGIVRRSFGRDESRRVAPPCLPYEEEANA